MKFAYFGEGAKNWEDVYRANSDPKAKGLLYYQNLLLNKKMPSIFASFEELNRVNILDLGSGNGTAIFPILEYFTKKLKNEDIRYIPLDLSKELLKTAKENVSKEFDLQITPHVRDFESGNFSDITFNLRRAKKLNLMTFIGNTLGNAPDMHRLLTNFRESMTKNDYLLIGVELANEHLIKRIVREYNAKEILNFVFWPLAYYGIKKSDGNIRVRFSRRLSRIEVLFIPGKDIHFTIGYEKIKLEKGNRILLWESTKFNGPMLTNLLSDAGFRIDLYTTTRENNFALILCQPSTTKNI